MKRITHLGIFVFDIESAVEQWTRLYNLKVVKRMEVPEEQVNSIFLSADGTPDGFLVELVEPMDPNDESHPVVQRLKTVGEGPFSLCMLEDDMPAARQRLQAAGARFAEREPIPANGDSRFIVGARASNGVLIELLPSQNWEKLWHAGNP